MNDEYDEEVASAREWLGLDDDRRTGPNYWLAFLVMNFAIWFGLIWCAYGLVGHILRGGE